MVSVIPGKATSVKLNSSLNPCNWVSMSVTNSRVRYCCVDVTGWNVCPQNLPSNGASVSIPS